MQVTKLLNYIQWNTAKSYAFAIFFTIWTYVLLVWTVQSDLTNTAHRYFRHYLNLWILWSVWFESSNVP